MSAGLDPLGLMERYALAYRPVGRLEPLGNAGGLSGARLWRYQAPRGEFVLRLWPESETDEARLGRRFEWMEALDALPFVSRPVVALDGRALQSFLGRWWHVEPWMPGACEAGRPPSEARVRAGLEGLARVHGPWERFGSVGASPGLKARLKELDWLSREGGKPLRDAVLAAPDGPECQAALAWLDEAPRLFPGVRRELGRAVEWAVPLQPTLRDVRSDHLLFSGDQLTGLVDFGALEVESPAADLARLLADWFEPKDKRRRAALEAYERVRRLDSRTAALVGLFEWSADVLLGARWVRWRFVERRVFEDEAASLRGLETGLQRLRRRVASEVGRSIRPR